MASGIIEKSGYVTLWTNPNPTAAFAAQTISVDLSDYDAVFVYFKRDSPTLLMLNPVIIFKPYILDDSIPFVAANTVTAGGQLGRRIFNVSKTQIEFTNADRYNSYSSTAIGDNSTLIPDKIIGVKF